MLRHILTFSFVLLRHVCADPLVWGPKEDFIRAFNEGSTFKRTTWGAMARNEEAQMKLEGVWWSAKPRTLQLTVFTQSSMDRLKALVAQCRSWQGPLSAAVYVPLVQPDTEGTASLSQRNADEVRQAVEAVQRAFDMLEDQAHACQLDVMLVSEVFDDEQSTVRYPFNYLRNYARLQVRTPLLAMIDADLLISSSLSGELEHLLAVEFHKRQCAQGVMMVLPAFETAQGLPLARGGRVAVELARGTEVTKSQLNHAYLVDKTIIPFRHHTYFAGHGPTDFARWLDPKTKRSYTVQFAPGFEPWFATCTGRLPAYDVRFRGHGGDKVVAVASMVYYNNTFAAHPDAWLVHKPHRKTRAKAIIDKQLQARLVHGGGDSNATAAVAPQQTLASVLHELLVLVADQMKAGTYAPVTDERLRRVMQRLPWLQVIPSFPAIASDPLRGFLSMQV